MSLKILLTGCTGQVGSEIQRRSTKFGFHLIPHNHSTLDLSNRNEIASVLRNEEIDLVINAAAYTAVDKAETEQELAHLTNSTGVKYLALIAKDYGVPVFHISTDYIFDGLSTTAYNESSNPNPQTVYGESKLAGEQHLTTILPEHIILRTSWVFGLDGNNFVKTMLRLGETNDELRVVADQIGNPTFAGDIAETLLQLADQYHRQDSLPWGTYHYCNHGSISWHSFAERIVQLGHQHKLIKKLPVVVPISTSEYPTPATRPSNSSLDCSLFVSTFTNIAIGSWLMGLEHMISTISGESA